MRLILSVVLGAALGLGPVACDGPPARTGGAAGEELSAAAPRTGIVHRRYAGQPNSTLTMGGTSFPATAALSLGYPDSRSQRAPILSMVLRADRLGAYRDVQVIAVGGAVGPLAVEGRHVEPSQPAEISVDVTNEAGDRLHQRVMELPDLAFEQKDGVLLVSGEIGGVQAVLHLVETAGAR